MQGKVRNMEILILFHGIPQLSCAVICRQLHDQTRIFCTGKIFVRVWTEKRQKTEFQTSADSACKHSRINAEGRQRKFCVILSTN